MLLLLGKHPKYLYNRIEIVGCNVHTSNVTIINRLLEK